MNELKTKKEETLLKKDSRKKISSKEKLIQSVQKNQIELGWFASILI
ncbi:MAG: hypothetical protein PHY04_03750 [Candidatus ainarchaeum sp.]|jgi:hypothetical protein|nr:hypothetical protein [Candidatus ainarchaeum sp.]MDD3086238.1 hypothetical protein [Candidatus ainarchaeum sp.]MDD4128822.1 hypothetical protein [Candidatus ainarchaeum sp.]MDD4467626.1 hypothetical protein [Candidatus ainarchaeum sp.]HPM86230.1 hypothetical protein [archaeon]